MNIFRNVLCKKKENINKNDGLKSRKRQLENVSNKPVERRHMFISNLVNFVCVCACAHTDDSVCILLKNIE